MLVVQWSYTTGDFSLLEVSVVISSSVESITMCIYIVSACRWTSTQHIIIIIYPLTMRVIGAPQMISQPVFSIFSCSQCPLGLGKLQACPFSDVVFLHLPLSALSSSPFHCALQDDFGQTWWTENITIPLQFVSLFDGQEVFSIQNYWDCFIWLYICSLGLCSCRLRKPCS